MAAILVAAVIILIVKRVGDSFNRFRQMQAVNSELRAEADRMKQTKEFYQRLGREREYDSA